MASEGKYDNDHWIRVHAERIADSHLEDIEYANVYEDEVMCENFDEEDWQTVHTYIQKNLVSIPYIEYMEFKKFKEATDESSIN